MSTTYSRPTHGCAGEVANLEVHQESHESEEEEKLGCLDGRRLECLWPWKQYHKGVQAISLKAEVYELTCTKEFDLWHCKDQGEKLCSEEPGCDQMLWLESLVVQKYD